MLNIPPPFVQADASVIEYLRLLANSLNTVYEGWDDLRFPAQGINPPGAAADPVRSTTTGLLEFSGSADNIIAGVAQLPHAWKRGSTLRPHIHLLFPTSTATNTRWKFEYNVASVNENFINTYGAYTTLSTITVANPQNVKKHAIAGFGDLTTAGLKESSVLLWKISRLAASDAADTHTSAVVLLEFDIHFQTEKAGTDREIPD